jgi:hypothetical protein
MRTMMLLAAGCAAGAPQGQPDDRLARSDVALPLTYTCADAYGPCDTLVIGLAADERASWWIDGEPQPSGPTLSVKVPQDGGVEVMAATDAGGLAEAWVQAAQVENADGVFDPYVTILGHQGSCTLFHIVAVGGCLYSPGIRFDGRALPGNTLLSPVRFSISPAGLSSIGYAWAARWPGGSYTTGGAPSGWSSGFDHWFALGAGQSLDITATHTGSGVWGPSHPVGLASCTGDGPVVHGGQ